jgi:hypothetical protein
MRGATIGIRGIANANVRTTAATPAKTANTTSVIPRANFGSI